MDSENNELTWKSTKGFMVSGNKAFFGFTECQQKTMK